MRCVENTLASSGADLTPVPTIAHLDESDLLALIFPHLPGSPDVLVGPGDDCAQVKAPDGTFVVSTDILIEGVHFKPQWSTGYHVGWRAAMQNLADIAAMGARPTSLVVGLAMPKTTPVDWVVEFAQGLGDAARSVGAAVVGGDLSSAPTLFISVTVHGDCSGRAPVLRSGARVGDVVALAGHTGWSAAGLELLLGQGPESPNVSVATRETESPSTSGALRETRGNSVGKGSGADAPEQAACSLAVQSFRAPTAPIGSGSVAAEVGATAMMDVSDGLLRDSQRMCKASGVSFSIDYAAVVAGMPAPQYNPRLSSAIEPAEVTNSASGLLKIAENLPMVGVKMPAEHALGGHVPCEHESTGHRSGEHESSGKGPCGHKLDGGMANAQTSDAGKPDAQAKVATWLLTGGEDHALLATFPASVELPDGFFRIGTVLEASSEDNLDATIAQEDLVTHRSSAKDSGADVQQPATQSGAVRVVGVDLGGIVTGWDHFR